MSKDSMTAVEVTEAMDVLVELEHELHYAQRSGAAEPLERALAKTAPLFAVAVA